MIEVGTAVRFTAGKYNGFQGTAAKLCESVGSFIISFEGRNVEVIEDLIRVASLQEWLASRSQTERALKGNP